MNFESGIIQKRETVEDGLLKQAQAALNNEIANNFSHESLNMADLENCLNYIILSFGLTNHIKGKVEDEDELLKMMLESNGIMYNQVKNIKESFKHNSNIIYLAKTKDNKWIVIEKSFFGRYYYSPSLSRKHRMSSSIVLSEEVYEIYRPFPNWSITDKPLSFLRLVGYVLTSIPTYKIIVLLVLTLSFTLLGLLIPAINKAVLGKYISFAQDASSYFLMLFISYLIIAFLRGIIQAYKYFGMSLIENDCGKALQSAVMMRVLRKPLSYFDKTGSGRITAYIYNARKLGTFIASTVLSTFVSVLFSLLYFPQIGKFASSLVFPSFILVTIQVLLSLLAMIANRANTEDELETDSKLKEMTYTTLNGISKIKTSGAWKRAFVKWADLYRKILCCNYDPALLVKLKPLIQTLFTSISGAVLLTIAVINNVSASDYIAFTTSYAFVTSATSLLCNMIDSLSTMRPSYEQLLPILDANDIENDGENYVNHIYGDVSFENVSFTYKDNNAFKLSNLSLDIKKGEKVGIAGESGSGKSTLINMLIGITKPDTGRILIDRKPLNTLNLQSVCSHIGYVSQQGKLFPGTLKYNVTLGDCKFTDEEVWRVLDLAAIADYVRELPEGLDTNVSETCGGGFSGGQKQRILLARALIRKPCLLILDEATSALDNTTQKKVMQNINSLKCTVIMVAHRLSTLKNCDYILLVKNGDIFEKGSYEELMEKNGDFANLVKRQEIKTNKKGETI